MIVVSDTTPIISLLKADRLDLLEKLFGEVLIPDGVYLELVSNSAFQEEAVKIRVCPFIRRVSVPQDDSLTMLRRATGLDLGESEAIYYADVNAVDLLLMDEVALLFKSIAKYNIRPAEPARVSHHPLPDVTQAAFFISTVLYRYASALILIPLPLTYRPR